MSDKYKTSELSRMLASYLRDNGDKFITINELGEYRIDYYDLTYLIDTFYEELP